MAEVPKIFFDVEKIPHELKQRRQWICWHYEKRGDNWDKIPLLASVDRPIRVDVTDPTFLFTFNEAVETAKRNGWGIGFVFYSGDPYTGIDLDDIDVWRDEAWEIVKKANSYAERSPSGKGIKIIVKGKVERNFRHGNLEVYGRDRFFTITGDHVEGTPPEINDAQQLLDELYTKYGKGKSVEAVDIGAIGEVERPEGGWENYVNELGYTLGEVRQKDKILDEYLGGRLAGKPSPSEADMGTLERLLFWGYSPEQAVSILKEYRWREKLLREDYVLGMLKKLLPIEARAPAKITPPTELPPATEVGETFSFMGDRLFNGRVQISALATPVSRFSEILFKCKEPGECEIGKCPLRRGLKLSINDEKRFDPSAWATYFDTNNPLDALSVFAEKRNFQRCPEWRKKVVFQGRSERAVTHALVYDLSGREGRAWFIHSERCDLRRCPNWIIGVGWLCRGYRGRIGVLIVAFTSESEVLAPPAEEVEKSREILRGLAKPNGLEGSGAWQIAEILRKAANAKGDEVRKGFMADLLTIASPVWVQTPESGDKELGATTGELGPSTNYKSQRARFLVNWLGAGKYLRGRKTEAGLTVGLEKVEGIGWVAKKGALPSADLSYIIVDNMPIHALDEQIESRRDGICTIAGIKNMELWARCRLKILNNPAQPFDELVYKCVALKMFDGKFLARFAFAIYTYGVPIDIRYDSTVYSLTEDDKKILDAARTILRWNLSQEITYKVPSDLWPKIMQLSKGLEERYGVEDIPLLLRNIPYKLAVIAYSFALLEGEVSPSERHYQLANQWLDSCARDIELDRYAEIQRILRTLSDDEFSAINEALIAEMSEDVGLRGGTLRDSYIFRIIDHIVKRGKTRRDELAAFLSVDEKTITRKVNILKGLGLLRSDKDGYSFTPKGVKFVKKWIELVPDVSVVPDSKGQPPCGGKHEEPIPPKGGDMEDMRDKLHLADLIQKVRLAFKGGSLEEFLNTAGSLGLSREEAEALFKLLLRECRLAVDPAGNWRWIK